MSTRKTGKSNFGKKLRRGLGKGKKKDQAKDAVRVVTKPITPRKRKDD